MKINIEKSGQFVGHRAPVYVVAESANSGHIYSGGGDRMLVEWNLERTGQSVVVAKATGSIYSCSILPERDILLVGNSQGGIHVVDLNLKKEIKYLLSHKLGVFCLLLFPEKNILFAGGADGVLSVWETNNFTCLYRAKYCEGKIRDMALNADKSQLVLACGDGLIRILSTSDFSTITYWLAHETSVNTVAFHPSQAILLSGGRDAHLNIWDIHNPGLALEKIPAHNYAIYSIRFHPEGKIFATASRDKTIKVWESDKMTLLQRLDKEKYAGHSYSVNALSWINNGRQLISASDDKTLILWNIEST